MSWGTHQAVLETHTTPPPRNQWAVGLWGFLSLYKPGQGCVEVSPSPFSPAPPTPLSKPCASLCPFPDLTSLPAFHGAQAPFRPTQALLAGVWDSKVPKIFLMPSKTILPRSVSDTPTGLALLSAPGLLTTIAAVPHFPLRKTHVKSSSLLPKSSKTQVSSKISEKPRAAFP